MAQVFRSQGFEVVHDTTLYDYPAYNGAYERSCAGVEKWLEQYPTIKLVLDVHRDALVSADGAAYKLVSEVEGQKVAQVMLVVGSNDSGMEHPNWRENLALGRQAPAGAHPGLGTAGPAHHPPLQPLQPAPLPRFPSGRGGGTWKYAPGGHRRGRLSPEHRAGAQIHGGAVKRAEGPVRRELCEAYSTS